MIVNLIKKGQANVYNGCGYCAAIISILIELYGYTYIEHNVVALI